MSRFVANRSGEPSEPPIEQLVSQLDGDVFLEGEPPPQSLDHSVAELTCKVQVKTTREASSIDISLKNWERMAKQPIPFFVLVVIVDEHRSAKEAYLVHIDHEWVGKALKRLRKLDPESRADLHKTTMALTWDPEDRLDPLHGSALDGAIRQAVGNDLQSYVEKKVQWCRTVGYGDAPYRTKFTFPATPKDEFYRLLADFAVGLVEDLEVSGMRTQETRFGISRELPELTTDATATIRISKLSPNARFRLDLFNKSGTTAVSVDCDAYCAKSVVPFLPEHHATIRLVSDSVSVVLRPKRLPDESLTFSVDIFLSPYAKDDTTSLRILGDCTSVAAMIEASEDDPLLLGFGKANGECRTVQASGGRLCPESRDFYRKAELLLAIGRMFDLSASTEVNLREVDKQWNTFSLLAQAARTENFKMTIDLPGPSESRSGEGVLVVCAPLTLGNLVVAACLSITADVVIQNSPEGETSTVSVSSRSIEVERTWKMPLQAWHDFDPSGALADLEASHKKQGRWIAAVMPIPALLPPKEM